MKMNNSLYKAKTGTPHIVQVIGKYREMLKGETLDNTARTYQILAQRQKEEELCLLSNPPKYIKNYFNDTDFEPFTMEEELFLENYEALDETQTN